MRKSSTQTGDKRGASPIHKGEKAMPDLVTVNGMIRGEKKPLVEPIDRELFINTLIAALKKPKGEFRAEAALAVRAMAPRALFEFRSLETFYHSWRSRG
jgi:hypothetical protein